MPQLEAPSNGVEQPRFVWRWLVKGGTTEETGGAPRDIHSPVPEGLDEGLKRRARKIPREGLQELRKARRLECTPLRTPPQGGWSPRRRMSAPCRQGSVSFLGPSIRDLNRSRPLHPFLIKLTPRPRKTMTAGEPLDVNVYCQGQPQEPSAAFLTGADARARSISSRDCLVWPRAMHRLLGELRQVLGSETDVDRTTIRRSHHREHR